MYCGDSGGSEPETKALIAHVEAFDPKAYVSFHNAAGDVMGNDIPLAQKLTDAFSEGSGYRRETLADWSALEQTGTAKEWCEKRGLAYVEVEGRYRWGADWVNHQKGIRAMLDALLTEREH